MELTYQGLSGKNYVIMENKVAGGGEGSIHAICNNEIQVAKIFKEEKRSKEREEKLCCMVKSASNDLQMEEVTWPQDVIYDHTGFCGYIMRKVTNASSLASIYSTGGNEFDLRYRILAAINLCHAIQTVHNMGQVCGDLNPQNICINLDLNDMQHAFHITLVDTDSYHFTSVGKTYRCEVGLADYIAPEVQKKMTNGSTLKTASLPTYTKETDLFALAVHIFTLLMNGCHPFACAKDVNGTFEDTMNQMDESFLKDSVVAPQPIENIKNGFFPFYEKRNGITYPMYAPSFDSLPMSIQNLFVRTFVDGYNNPAKRVDTQEWIDALMPLRDNIFRCYSNAKHYYFSQNTTCPLCHIEERIRELVGPPPEEVVFPDSEDFEEKESQESVDSTNTGLGPGYESQKRWLKGLSAGCSVWIIIWAIIVLIFIIGVVASSTDGNSNHNVYENESVEESAENEAQKQKNQYQEYLQSANDYLSASNYDKTIEVCEQALSINDKSRSALYMKGKALYGKNQLSDALDVIRLGKDTEYNAEFDDYDSELYSELLDLEGKIEDALEEQKKQREKMKADKACLKYGNKIKEKIEQKKYKAALKLIRKGSSKDYFEDKNKIYIKDGKLSGKINSGKGFVYYILKDYAYIGTFKNGKASGKGIEVGDPEDTAYDGYYTINGTFKGGYPNGECTVYYSKYDNDASATFIGTYKRGWENGSFTWIDKNFKGGHSDTYYFSSVMGKRKVIKMYEGDYVYAKANSGWFYYCSSKSSLSGYTTENHGKKH